MNIDSAVLDVLSRKYVFYASLSGGNSRGLAGFGGILAVWVLGISVIFIGNAKPLNAENRISSFVSNGGLVEANPSRFVDNELVGIRKIAVENFAKDKDLSVPTELRQVVLQNRFEKLLVKPSDMHCTTGNNNPISYVIFNWKNSLQRKLGYILNRCATHTGLSNHGWRSAFIPRMDSESPHWAGGRLDGNQYPWTFGVDNRLSIQQCGLSSLLSLVGLPANSHEGKNDGPCCRPVRPSKEAIPTWKVPFGVFCVALGMFIMNRWGNRRDGWICALVWCLAGGALILTGYVDCESKDYSTEYRQTFQHKEESSRLHPQRFISYKFLLG